MTFATIDLALSDVVMALSSQRLPCNTETELQGAIGAALARATIEHVPEHRLDPRNRLDFRIPVGSRCLAIEAKIGGSRLAAWRQCERYCGFDEVLGLVLVGTVSVPAGLSICAGKPFRFVSVGRAWL